MNRLTYTIAVILILTVPPLLAGGFSFAAISNAGGVTTLTAALVVLLCVLVCFAAGTCLALAIPTPRPATKEKTA